MNGQAMSADRLKPYKKSNENVIDKCMITLMENSFNRIIGRINKAKKLGS